MRKRRTRVAVMKCHSCGTPFLIVQDLGIPWTGRQGKIKVLAGSCSCNDGKVTEHEWEVNRSDLVSAIGRNTFAHW